MLELEASNSAIGASGEQGLIKCHSTFDAVGRTGRTLALNS